MKILDQTQQILVHLMIFVRSSIPFRITKALLSKGTLKMIGY